MKKFSLTLIATACALVLSGCYSSGGGGGSVATPSSQVYGTETTPSNSGTSNTTTSPTTNTNNAGTSTVPATSNAEAANPSTSTVIDSSVKPTTPTALTDSTTSETPSTTQPTTPYTTAPNTTKPADTVITDNSVKVTEETSTAPTGDRTDGVAQKEVNATSAKGITAEVVRTAFANTFGRSANTAVQGGVLTIKSDAITAENPKSTDFDVLFLDEAQILLLAKAEDKWGDISTRALSSSDIQKNPQNQQFTGHIGSTKISKYQQALFENMRFGVITHNGVDSLVVQGKPTILRDSTDSNLEAMPNSGFFGYDGYALYGKDGNYQQLTTRALVDFAKNTIEVRLTNPNDSTQKITFGGTVSGNTFSGTQNGIETKGGFYGERAKDLGGVFYVLEGDSKDSRGVFGASDKFRANANE